MKIQRILLLVTAIVAVVPVSVLAMSGGDYTLSWSTIDGGGGRSSGGPYTLTGTIGQPDAAWSAGGGRSSGGPYTLTGTIGQPDAAYSSGGDYELLGGFWPGGPLCFVDFYSFARFAEHWLDKPCNEGNNFCGGADLYEDENNIVNELDLGVFVDEWLCYCPTGWPLK